QAQVDHRHDGAAQVDDALDVVRRVRNAGNGVIATDFLHFEDIHAVVFVAEGEAEEFTAGAGGRGAGVVHGDWESWRVPVRAGYSTGIGVRPADFSVGAYRSPFCRALRSRSIRKM